MRAYLIPFLLVAVLLASLGGIGIYYASLDEADRDDLLADLGLETSTEGEIHGSGFIEAELANLAIELAGTVESVDVSVGDKVDEGEPLMSLSSEALESELIPTRTTLIAAKAQLAELRAGSPERDIERVELALLDALEAADEAETALDDLRDGGRDLTAELTLAEARYDLARLSTEVAQAQLNLLRAGPGAMDLAVAEAAVAQADARMEGIVARLERLTLLAPADGQVFDIHVREGEAVLPGRPLLRFGTLDPVRLTIYVSEQEVGDLETGQDAEITVDAFDDKTFEGEIVAIAAEAEFTPKNVLTKDERANLVYAVEIELRNAKGDLKPGMPADAIIEEK